MRKELFVKLINTVRDIDRINNDLSNAIGACELSYDRCIDELMNAVIDDMQAYIDENCEYSGIDVGEIFLAWYDNRPNKPYLIRIDNDEYNAKNAGELYNLFEILKERFAEATNIDYATTM